MAESDEWGKMKRAKEDAFFERQNKEALERLKRRKGEKPRLSPVTGELMEQLTYLGVVIDRCPKSGGIWLDAGELEQIINAGREKEKHGEPGWLANFLQGLKGK